MAIQTIDVLISTLAANQLGLVTRAGLLSVGVTSRQIDLRVSAGFLVVVHRGVYRVASAPITWEQRVLAAILAGGPQAAASHRSAARIFGLRGIETAPVEIVVPRNRRPTLDRVVVHRTETLYRADVTTRGLLRVTSPARTLFDLASVLDIETVEGASEDAVLKGLASWDYLLRTGERLAGRGHAGSGRFLELLGEHHPGTRPTESELEDEVIRLLRRAGLPTPERQIAILGARTNRARVHRHRLPAGQAGIGDRQPALARRAPRRGAEQH